MQKQLLSISVVYATLEHSCKNSKYSPFSNFSCFFLVSEIICSTLLVFSFADMGSFFFSEFLESSEW